MPVGLIGVKVGMTQVFDENQLANPVTVLRIGPCPVLQVRTKAKDGYDALQLGFDQKLRRKANKAERGHVAAELESRRRKGMKAAGVEMSPKANCEPPKHIREFRLDAPASQAVGAILTVTDVFKDVPKVDVIGFSKGRGFTGVVKRHNYGGLRASHGVKKGEKQRGSIASNASNRGSGRPKKGITMAGRHGNERTTVRNLKVVKIDTDNNLIMVKGAVPGPNGGVVMIRPTNKR